MLAHRLLQAREQGWLVERKLAINDYISERLQYFYIQNAAEDFNPMKFMKGILLSAVKEGVRRLCVSAFARGESILFGFGSATSNSYDLKNKV